MHSQPDDAPPFPSDTRLLHHHDRPVLHHHSPRPSPHGLPPTEAEHAVPTLSVDRFFSAYTDELALSTPAVELPDPASALIPSPIPPAPAAVGVFSETPTPLHEHLPDLGIAGIVGHSLPSDAALPSPPIAKAARNLRLPSFDMLGIAVPHPDRIVASLPSTATPWIGAGPLSQPNDPLHLESPSTLFPIVSTEAESTPASLSPAHVLPGHRSIQRYILTQTPPEETDPLDWLASDAKTSVVQRTQSSTPSAQPNLTSPFSATSAATTPATEMNTHLHRSVRQEAPWLREALPLILENVSSQARRNGQITVLSQALPVPSSPGHAFPALIEAINSRIQPQSMVWINVFHAVPGTLNLADLPTSPPSTPAQPHEGEDYFTTKVFDSAVTVPDYQGNDPVSVASPRPAVAPCSVDITFVERYIPPTSAKEFSELFVEAGRSILSDRLVELSPYNGTLLFVYPTRRGGRTFVNDYLSPILEPILRSVMVTEKLSSNLMEFLGSMPAVDEMMSFEDMDARMEAFCQQLNSTSRTPLSKFSNMTAAYTLLHSSRQTITLDKSYWAADWWIKQEKPRMREAIKNYYANQRRADDAASPLFAGVELVEKILNGVRDRRYPTEGGGADDGQRKEKVPTAGVEVAVFVVQKTAARRGSSGQEQEVSGDDQMGTESEPQSVAEGKQRVN